MKQSLTFVIYVPIQNSYTIFFLTHKSYMYIE